MAQEADLGLGQIDAGGGLKELHHGGVAVDLQHLAPADGAVGQLHLRQLVVGDVLHHFDHHQRGRDLLDGFILSDHSSSPAFLTTSSISFSMASEISAYTWEYSSAGTLLARPMRSLAGISNSFAVGAPLVMASRHSLS